MYALFAALAQMVERVELKAPRIGEDGTVPAHEAMQAAELRDHVLAGPEVEVIGVRQDPVHAHPLQLLGREAADHRVGPHRKEGRRVELAVGRVQTADARGALA